MGRVLGPESHVSGKVVPVEKSAAVMEHWPPRTTMQDNDIDNSKSNGSIDHTNPDTLERMYWGEGMTLKEIGELSDVSSRTIRRYMDRNGIERRETAEYNKKDYCSTVMEGNGYINWHSSDPDGKQRTMKVHRLLAISIYGFESVKGKHIHHKNSIPWDNRPDNIEVMNPEDHHSHHMQGESHNLSKLSEGDVRKIDYLLEEGCMAQKDMAKEYGVSESNISEIKNGRSWSHVTGR